MVAVFPEIGALTCGQQLVTLVSTERSTRLALANSENFIILKVVPASAQVASANPGSTRAASANR